MSFMIFQILLTYAVVIIISVDTGPAHIAAYSATPLIWIIKSSPYSIIINHIQRIQLQSKQKI